MTEYVIANFSDRYGPYWIYKPPHGYSWSAELVHALRYSTVSDVNTAIKELISLGVPQEQLSVLRLHHAERITAPADYQKPLQLIEARIEEIRSEYINKLNIFDGLKAEWRRAVHQLEYIARKLKEA